MSASGPPNVSLSDIVSALQTVVASQQMLVSRVERVEQTMREISQQQSQIARQIHENHDHLSELRADLTRLELDDARMLRVEDSVAEMGNVLVEVDNRLRPVEQAVRAMAAGSFNPMNDVDGTPDPYADEHCLASGPLIRTTGASESAASSPSTSEPQALATFESPSESGDFPDHSQAIGKSLVAPATASEILSAELSTLFLNVDSFARDFLTLPYHEHVANPNFCATAATALSKHEHIRGHMRFPQRISLCAGVINRMLHQEVLYSNIYADFDNDAAKQFNTKEQSNKDHRTSKPLDVQGRGENCIQLARLARNVIKQSDFMPYLDQKVIHVEKLILDTIGFLITSPSNSGNHVEKAINDIVNHSFRIAIHMSTLKFEHSICFPKPFSAFNPDLVVVCETNKPDLTQTQYVVRLGVSPVVMQKTVKKEVTAVTLHKAQVLVTPKRITRGRNYDANQHKKKELGMASAQ